MATKLNAQEKKWQANDDAYTLMRAEQLTKDPVRLEAARKEIDVIAKQKKEELNSLDSLLSKKKNGKYPWDASK